MGKQDTLHSRLTEREQSPERGCGGRCRDDGAARANSQTDCCHPHGSEVLCRSRHAMMEERRRQSRQTVEVGLNGCWPAAGLWAVGLATKNKGETGGSAPGVPSPINSHASGTHHTHAPIIPLTRRKRCQHAVVRYQRSHLPTLTPNRRTVWRRSWEPTTATNAETCGLWTMYCSTVQSNNAYT